MNTGTLVPKRLDLLRKVVPQAAMIAFLTNPNNLGSELDTMDVQAAARAMGQDLIVPNARRDNFEVNHHYYNLLVQLGPVAAKITQICRTASVSRNAEQSVRIVIAEVSTRLKQRRSFDRAELSRLKSSLLRARAKANRIAAEH